MTTDLDRLIEAVESGGTVPWMGAIKPLGIDNATSFGDAQCGSVTATVALLEALLPGWGWSMQGYGRATVWPPGSIAQQTAGAIEIYGKPTRALLLATLRAYRSTREGG